MRDFAGNWTGTGTISGSGDAETICLEEGQYMESEIVSTGDQYVELFQNLYNGAGDDVVMKYRTGATTAACFVAPWEVYYTPFLSAGYAQVRLESTLTLELSVSQDGRYLTKGGSPWLLIGDSPQGMISDLTPAQMATYMANRQGYGINFIQVHLISGTTFGGANNTTFPAQDGTTPFTTTGDIATPREAYFAQVDDLINLAASYDMIVCLTVAECINALTLWQDNGETKCRNFGAYVGNRYKDFPNIIWNYGNDFHYLVEADNTLILAVQEGVAGADSNHLHTAWLGEETLMNGSRDDASWESRVDIDLVYPYYTVYAKMDDDYALTPAKPTHLGESNYLGESIMGYLTTAYIIRKQNYWAMLSGGSGVVYCNGPDTYAFDSGWETRLDDDGIVQIPHLTALFGAYDWWLMVPDTTSTVITAGRGTYDDTQGSIETNDYATCAYLADGSLAMIYMPTNRTMTVDMSFFNGTVTCRWFDPTNGTYTADAASPHTNSGTHDFSRATTNSDGDADWVLVLET